MNDIGLYEKLAIPADVVSQLTEYGSIRDIRISDKIKNKILNRSQWDEGIKELQALLGDDPDGIKMLWELLNLISSYSYEEYHKYALTIRMLDRQSERIKKGVQVTYTVAGTPFCFVYNQFISISRVNPM